MGDVIILNERPKNVHSPSAHDAQRVEQTARMFGYKFYDIPSGWKQQASAEDILCYLPEYDAPTPAFINGFIPSTMDEYRELYQACAAKKVFLLNDPEESERCLEFHQAYPFIEELTPKTEFVRSVDELSPALARLDFPVFIKGSVRSRKALGWSHCVAYSEEEARQIASDLLASEYQSRGVVIVRQLVNLRHIRVSDDGFPFGREFRVFLYRDTILNLGYYWDEEDALAQLTEGEEAHVKELAIKASSRLAVPYVAIDVAQTEDGTWIVIEPGDAQFAGMGQQNILPLFSRLKDILDGN